MTLLAQTSFSYSLSDILGGARIALLLLATVYSMIVCGLAIKRVSFRTLVTAPILAFSISAWVIGTLLFQTGTRNFSMGMSNGAMDPSAYLMDAGSFLAVIGASLLMLALTGGLVFLSFLLICCRTNRNTKANKPAHPTAGNVLL
jgi:hypothetical protein